MWEARRVHIKKGHTLEKREDCTRALYTEPITYEQRINTKRQGEEDVENMEQNEEQNSLWKRVITVILYTQHVHTKLAGHEREYVEEE